MKKLKQQLSNKLTWTFSESLISMKSCQEPLLELIEESSTLSRFSWEANNYIIRNEGIWSQRILIERDNKTELTFSREFLESKAKIEFENEKTYFCRSKGNATLKLSIYNKDKKSVLYYKLKPLKATKLSLHIEDFGSNKNELMLLVVLGCYIVNGLLKEKTKNISIPPLKVKAKKVNTVKKNE